MQVDTEAASGYGPPYVPARPGNANTGAPPVPDLATALVSLPPFPPKTWMGMRMQTDEQVVTHRRDALQVWLSAL